MTHSPSGSALPWHSCSAALLCACRAAASWRSSPLCWSVRASGSTAPCCFGTGVVIAALAIALASWYGFGLVKVRLATFWQGEAFDNRMPLWLRLLPMAGDFPLWGTGYGTFVYVESLYRADATLISFTTTPITSTWSY